MDRGRWARAITGKQGGDIPRLHSLWDGKMFTWRRLRSPPCLLPPLPTWATSERQRPAAEQHTGLAAPLLDGSGHHLCDRIIATATSCLPSRSYVSRVSRSQVIYGIIVPEINGAHLVDGPRTLWNRRPGNEDSRTGFGQKQVRGHMRAARTSRRRYNGGLP